MSKCTCASYGSMIPAGLHPHSLLCKQCRADLDLGRLVRAMKPGRVLTHAAKENEIEPEKPWESYSYVIEDGDCRFGGTPEEALKGGRINEED